MFVDWCFIETFGLELAMEMTGQKMNGYGAGCTASANYYRQIGRLYKSGPQPGDQIFFTNDGGKSMNHTGIVERVENGRVYTIEGNTSGDAGVVANGGSVNRKSYPLTYAKIGGYGRPDYSLAEMEDEEVNIDKLIEDMTPEQAKEIMAKARVVLQDNDASGYSEAARTWAVNSGLIQGGGSAEFNGMWQDFMSREQLATVLYRFAQMMGRA